MSATLTVDAKVMIWNCLLVGAIFIIILLTAILFFLMLCEIDPAYKPRIRAAVGTFIVVGVFLVVAGFVLWTIDRITFNVWILWPYWGIAHLGNLAVFVVGLAILFLRIVGVYKKTIGGIGTVIPILIFSAILIFFLPRTFLGTMPPDSEIAQGYGDGIRELLDNNIAEAIRHLEAISSHEWLLSRRRSASDFSLWRDVGDGNDILDSINGGTLNPNDIENCRIENRDICIAYAIKAARDYVILANILPDGRVYILASSGYETQAYRRGVPQISIPNDIRDIMEYLAEPRTVVYESIDAHRVTLDAFFEDASDMRRIQMTDRGYMEYYNVSCNGQQTNGYWISGTLFGGPPWQEFRQAVLEIIRVALRDGSDLEPAEFCDEIRSAEELYGFSSLTGYEWSKLYTGIED